MMGSDQDVRDIDDYFKTYIFGFMLNDIEKAINSGLNYIAALGLAVHSEVIGGLMTGKLRDKRASRKNFEKFLEHLGTIIPYYNQDNIKKVFYDNIRCGLVHEYFVKEITTNGDKGLIARVGVPVGKDTYEGIPGVFIDEREERILFFLRNYFRDFKLAVEKYYNQVVKDKDESLINNFKKSVGKKG